MPALEPVDHRSLLRLAWPILVSMLSYTTLAVVNSIFVGWLGTPELAAIGIGANGVYLVQGFGIGLLGGVRILVSTHTGAGEPAEARATTWLGLVVALALGGLSLAAIPLGGLLFAAMGASDEVRPLATAYFHWRLAAAPVTFLLHALTVASQGRGDTRSPMLANLLANGVNLVADPVLIFGLGPIPAMGIDGAGLGCGLGVSAGLALLAWRSRAALGPVVAPSWDRWRKLWRLGSPSGLHWTLDVVSFSLLGSMLAHAGDVHLAAHVIVVRIVMMSFLPCYALSEAVSVMVGQSVGAKDPRRARLAFRVGAIQAASLMLSLGALFVLAPAAMTGIFGAAEDVTRVATPIIVLYGALQVLDGVAVVAFGALSGAGDTRFTMRAGLAAAWLVKLPVAAVAIGGLSLGAYGAWLGIGAEIAFQFGLALWRLRGRRWLEDELAPKLVAQPA